MAHIHIKLQRKVLEIDKQAFYSIINGISKNVYDIAQSTYEDHKSGLLNSNGSNQTQYLWSQDKGQMSLLRAIEDEQIRHHFTELKKLVGKLQKNDKKIVLWLANHFGIESLDFVQNRQKLNRKLSIERRKAAENRTGLLSYVNEPEYKKFVGESLKTVKNIQEIVSKINHKIGMLNSLGLKHHNLFSNHSIITLNISALSDSSCTS